MADSLGPEERSALMAKVREKDTIPEKIVRRMVSKMGYRYRLYRRDLPGVPDLAMISRKKAIFVNGCFWHQHSNPCCKRSRIPQGNRPYWVKKLTRNVQRDKRNKSLLRKMDWAVCTVWECELKNPKKVEGSLRRFLSP